MTIGMTHIAEVLVALTGVVALILLAAFLFRQVLQRGDSHASAMKLVGGLSLGTREKVYLVDVAGRRVLVGVAPGCVSFHEHDAEPGEENRQ